MKYKFSKYSTRNYSIVILNGWEIAMSNHFRYKSSIIQNIREIDSDAKHMIKLAVYNGEA